MATLSYVFEYPAPQALANGPASMGGIKICVGSYRIESITAIGSTISAGNNVDLTADNRINLLAAQSTIDEKSSNRSNGASIGVGFAIGGSQNGFTLEAGANKARGHADGTDVIHTNTQVTAGNAVHLQSGSDTTLKGAVVAANTVTADLGELSAPLYLSLAALASDQSPSGLSRTSCSLSTTSQRSSWRRRLAE